MLRLVSMRKWVNTESWFFCKLWMWIFTFLIHYPTKNFLILEDWFMTFGIMTIDSWFFDFFFFLSELLHYYILHYYLILFFWVGGEFQYPTIGIHFELIWIPVLQKLPESSWWNSFNNSKNLTKNKVDILYILQF